MSMCSQYYIFIKKTVELLEQDGCGKVIAYCDLFTPLRSFEFPWYDWCIQVHTYFQ